MAKECVVLLHGLARTTNSMSVLAKELQSAGYHVANISYPSRELSVEALAVSHALTMRNDVVIDQVKHLFT